MASPPKIFISYRRNDSAPYAGRIADALADRYGERTVFFDVDSIEVGQDFQKALMKAIEDCEVMLVIIGRTWLSGGPNFSAQSMADPNNLVRLEIARALKAGKTLIPVLVGGAIFPPALILPEDIRDITKRQGVSLDDEYWLQGVQALFRALEYSTDLKPLKARGGFDIINEFRMTKTPGQGRTFPATPISQFSAPPAEVIEAKNDSSIPPLVFVSHADEDHALAENIVAKLEQSGMRCWVSYRDIPAGEPSWSGFIVSAIAKSKLMVIVLTENSVKSRQVLREVTLADQENIVFIPFRVDQAPLPDSFKYFFSTPQLLDGSKLDRGEALNSLTAAVQKRLAN